MDIMKRDDKRRPQVTGLCLKALAGEGVVSVHQQLDSTSVHMFFRLYLDTGSADKAELCVVPVLRLKQIYDSSAAFRDQRGDSSLPPEITEVGRKTASGPLICPKTALSCAI